MTEVGKLLCDVRPSRVRWLWQGRIPLGKLTVLDGDPGNGKSTLTMDLAARVTRGREMPDGTPGVDGGVVLLTAEDALDDTVVPRLAAAKGDPRRVVALETVGTGAEEHEPMLPDDLVAVEAAVNRVEAQLVIVDPLMAYLPSNVNANRDQDVRRVLRRLGALAERTGVALLVVRHLTKLTVGNAISRGGGSIGIIGAARSGLLVAKDPDDPDVRVLAVSKSNVGAPVPAMTYVLEGVSYPTDDGVGHAARVAWRGTSTMTADALLATAGEDPEERSALGDAIEFLREELQDGRRESKALTRKAQGEGISTITLRRAKAAIGVRAVKVRDTWFWEGPEREGDQGDQGDHGDQSRAPAHVPDPSSRAHTPAHANEHHEHLDHLDQVAPPVAPAAGSSRPIPRCPKCRATVTATRPDDAWCDQCRKYVRPVWPGEEVTP